MSENTQTYREYRVARATVYLNEFCYLFSGQFPDFWIFDPLFLAENESQIYPSMRAKFGCGPAVVSKGGGGTDRRTHARAHTQRDTAALYSNVRLEDFPRLLKTPNAWKTVS